MKPSLQKSRTRSVGNSWRSTKGRIFGRISPSAKSRTASSSSASSFERSISTVESLREQGRIHGADRLGDADRRELHLLEHVPAQIDAVGELRQYQAVGRNLEHGAFAHDERALAPRADAVGHCVGDLLHGPGEFPHFAFADDPQT